MATLSVGNGCRRPVAAPGSDGPDDRIRLPTEQPFDTVAPVQASFDDLGTPLDQVTFCIIDLETTGGRAADGGITEIAAVRFRAGRRLETFRSFVDPGEPIPHRITVLTGITDRMVRGAPDIAALLPSVLEFIGDAVIVGHNVRYDIGFLDAALDATGRGRLTNRRVDTLALARRLVRDEVPNCRLGTLAEHLRLPHRPSHRALDDVLATADLLHLLLERAGRLGVTGLDDLVSLPTIRGHAQASKLRLTENLPRRPGVYLFRSTAGHTLYVGRATDLRRRVRSYFSGDDRRKIGQLLRETTRIDHIVCTTTLEASVLEVRLIHALTPRFNRQLKNWRRYAYLRLTDEPFPRLSIVRGAKDPDALHLGPLPSHRMARRVADAIEMAAPLRRCTDRPGARPRSGPCAPAQMGVASCPCAGTIGPDDYDRIVDRVRRAIRGDAAELLDPLAARMRELAAAERFEEAADMRDRAAALSYALQRQRRFDRLRRAGRVRLELSDSGLVELDHGRLVRSWRIDRSGIVEVPLPFDDDPAPALFEPGRAPGTALPAARADELLCIARWLEANEDRVRVLESDGPVFPAEDPLPDFEPARERIRA